MQAEINRMQSRDKDQTLKTDKYYEDNQTNAYKVTGAIRTTPLKHGAWTSALVGKMLLKGYQNANRK